MSNPSDNNEENNTATGKKKRWSLIQNDLNEALNAWKELEKSEVTLSPEEEQFEKIKSIISQLQRKLEQF